MTQPIDIIVKKVFKNQGKTKKGKDYTLTKLLSQDKRYFSTFQSSSVISSITEGSQVRLEAEQSNDYPTNYSITKIVSVDNTGSKAAARESPNKGMGQGRPMATQATPSAAPASPHPITQEEGMRMLRDAIKEVQEEFPSIDISDLMPLVAQHYEMKKSIQAQKFSLEMSIIVQNNKLRNMGMIR